MNATLRCGKCGTDTIVTNCNIARIAVKCPCSNCGFPNTLVQMLENYYGTTLGNAVRRETKPLERAKSNDAVTSLIARLEATIQGLIDATVKLVQA